MRIVYQAFVLAFALLISPLAKADTLQFNISGEGNTYSFLLDSTPLVGASLPGFSFTVNNIDITVDDLFGATSDISFFSTVRGGGLSLLNLPGGKVDLTGLKLYSGSESAPVFAPGGPFSLSDSAGAPFDLTITNATPEPGTLTLLATGALATLGFVRRRRTVE
jgi:PEP-CTERM motif